MDHVQPRKNKNNIYVKLLTLSGNSYTLTPFCIL